MDKTRRGFLGLLGKGSVAGVVLGAGYVGGIDKGEPGGDRGMFNFDCTCGEGLAAEIPKEIGTVLEFDCTCGTKWTMTWMGDQFKTKRTWSRQVETEG